MRRHQGHPVETHGADSPRGRADIPRMRGTDEDEAETVVELGKGHGWRCDWREDRKVYNGNDLGETRRGGKLPD